MFDKFTDRSRKVLQIAKNEADGLKEVNSEHILLGLIRVQEGIAAHVLKNFNIYEKDIVPFISPCEKTESFKESIPLNEESKNLISNAAEAMRLLGHNYIGTEHLLLGILKTDQSNACRIIAKQADPKEINKECLRLLGLDIEVDINLVNQLRERKANLPEDDASCLIAEILEIILKGMSTKASSPNMVNSIIRAILDSQ